MPEERRLTISSSPHLAPDDVARHTFASVRRGFDPGEVRDYLESIATGLRHQAEREQELLAALAEAEERAANPVIDDAMLTAAVGKETARVLQSGHDAASEMVANATTEAQRMLAEATEVSERLVTEATEVSEQAQTRADALLAERLAEAESASEALRERTEHQVSAALEKVRSDAETITDQARAEGRAMLEEAQQLRARVLADLSHRRKVLHAQIEQLRAGRERLAETVHDVKRSVDAIAEDLFNAENEARLAAEVAGREAASRPDEGTPEEVATLLLAEEAETAPESDHGTGPAPDAPPPDVEESTPGPGSADVDATSEEAATAAAPPVEQVDALFAKLRAAQGDGDPAGGAPGTTTGADAGTDKDPVRDTTDESAADDGAADDDGADDDGPPEARHPLVAQRDELLAPITTTLSRRLKRLLQDNQNELLDQLRAKGTTWSTDLLPDETEQIDGLTTSALPILEEAADAGATFVGPAGERPHADALIAVAHTLADSIVGPLRKRLAAGDGLDPAEESAVTEHVGSAFREWKGERIERLAGDHVVAAFSLGSLAAATTGGTELEWVAVALPGQTPCPDCEDNGLNGAQAAGETFPTGHAHPPAHPGCRCLLAPSTP